MRLIISLLLLIFFNHCSFNKDSKYWTADTIKKEEDREKLLEILKKSEDTMSMTLEEYKIYIEDYTKKSNYPDISK